MWFASNLTAERKNHYELATIKESLTNKKSTPNSEFKIKDSEGKRITTFRDYVVATNW